MNNKIKRVAINIGGGFVPGINHVIAGVQIAADKLGWEVYGIHDGFNGLLFPERYPFGGIVRIPQPIEDNINGRPLISNAFSSDSF